MGEGEGVRRLRPGPVGFGGELVVVAAGAAGWLAGGAGLTVLLAGDLFVVAVASLAAVALVVFADTAAGCSTALPLFSAGG